MWLAIFLFFVIIVLLLYIDTRKPKNYPPGPNLWPIMGSIPAIADARKRNGNIFEATAEMSRKYGPVIGLKTGRDLMVIVYGAEAVKEFLMSDSLNGRPKGIFYKTRTFGKRRGIILTDGGFWQEQRRFILRQLREFGFGRKNMSSLVEEEAQHLVDYIRNSMNNNGSAEFEMDSLFSVSVLNTLWKMMAGIRYNPGDKNLKELQGILSVLFTKVSIFGAPFSFLPVLRFIAPDLSGYTFFKETHDKIGEFVGRELERHRKTHIPEEPRDLMDVYLNVLKSAEKGDSFSDEQLVALCIDMFVAGSETTTNTIRFGFMYLILNPDIQKKAQEELDRVLGDRSPSLDDRTMLPYVECVVFEAMRMFAGRALAVPHRAIRDTTLHGYSIPKDTTVVVNLHGCMMTEESGFKDPEVFRPERYLRDGKVHFPDNFIPFGLGKHRCLGESLARANVFLFTATLLQKFTFSVVPGCPPDGKCVDAVTPAPEHYYVDICLEVRNPNAVLYRRKTKLG